MEPRDLVLSTRQGYKEARQEPINIRTSQYQHTSTFHPTYTGQKTVAASPSLSHNRRDIGRTTSHVSGLREEDDPFQRSPRPVKTMASLKMWQQCSETPEQASGTMRQAARPGSIRLREHERWLVKYGLGKGQMASAAMVIPCSPIHLAGPYYALGVRACSPVRMHFPQCVGIGFVTRVPATFGMY